MPLDTTALRRMFAAIDHDVAAAGDELCRLDGLIGDADHGVTMALGFGAAHQAVAALDPTADPTALLNAAALAFLNATGASCGPLYATALMRAAAAVAGRRELDDADVIAVVGAIATGIRDRGKAEPGQKTMLDAWVPAADAANAAHADGEPLGVCLTAAVDAARAGAEATRDMAAAVGRSQRLGDRALGHVDPGAASAAIVVEAMRRSLTT
ncbi:MAG: dihydroxyacetone kinase subunit DhaL [Ilumatobacteraceae bacterium]|nr:dihydroxyacetone kinase subunit DhaL [Ilumatobacteraceae bacterium]